MPVYGVAQAGGALTCVIPGDGYVLFDGTETPGAGVKSVAFSRGMGPGAGPHGMVFTVAFASAPTATVLIQGSNTDVEADYQTLGSIAAQHGYYADEGRFKFYRANLSAYSAGGMPVVIVQR